jgi:predicted ester cyclase
MKHSTPRVMTFIFHNTMFTKDIASDKCNDSEGIKMRKMTCLLLVLALLGITMIPTAAQEVDPAAANRANIYLFAEYVKNRNMPELLPLINADSYIGHTPFTPEGGHSTMAETIASEVEMNKAFDLDYTSYLVLAEGDATALLGYQEADFTGELFGTPPTGKHFGGLILFLSEYEKGLCTRDIELWNQVDFMQFMGWSPVTYSFDSKPWQVHLGMTSTTPKQHHRVMQAMWDTLGSGAAIGSAYAKDVVTHDYLETLKGVEPTASLYGKLAALPGFKVERTKIVCEGDLCASAAVTSVRAIDKADEDGRTYILWAALHRFVDGKIVEEWRLYDNAALWAFIPPKA